ncbi:hypothetical protein GGX14DRAFT_636819 [Mycena pura]|uniref:Uncharacterized protein n=1 Tax=Mycena pura TaxID=153505 RepID=A0AAD6VHK4_9AGAR|nr:hypothetical protein GGX14DRAFT_636819 [Mycena pura]
MPSPKSKSGAEDRLQTCDHVKFTRDLSLSLPGLAVGSGSARSTQLAAPRPVSICSVTTAKCPPLQGARQMDPGAEGTGAADAGSMPGPAAADASNGIAYTPVSHFGCRPTNAHRMHSGALAPYNYEDARPWRVPPTPPPSAIMIMNMLTPSPPANMNATSSVIQLAPASAAFVADRTTSLGSCVMAAFMNCILMGPCSGHLPSCMHISHAPPAQESSRQLATFGTEYRAQRHAALRNRLQRFYLAVHGRPGHERAAYIPTWAAGVGVHDARSCVSARSSRHCGHAAGRVPPCSRRMSFRTAYRQDVPVSRGPRLVRRFAGPARDIGNPAQLVDNVDICAFSVLSTLASATSVSTMSGPCKARSSLRTAASLSTSSASKRSSPDEEATLLGPLHAESTGSTSSRRLSASPWHGDDWPPFKIFSDEIRCMHAYVDKSIFSAAVTTRTSPGSMRKLLLARLPALNRTWFTSGGLPLMRPPVRRRRPECATQRHNEGILDRAFRTSFSSSASSRAASFTATRGWWARSSLARAAACPGRGEMTRARPSAARRMPAPAPGSSRLFSPTHYVGNSPKPMSAAATPGFEWAIGWNVGKTKNSRYVLTGVISTDMHPQWYISALVSMLSVLVGTSSQTTPDSTK